MIYGFQMVEEETQKRIELLIKKRVDSILESRKQQIEDEINKRVSCALSAIVTGSHKSSFS
jgi:primosomal replication protein N